MIAKAKVISHGSNAIRYSVDKDKAEIVKTNLLPDDISPTAMWARMLALQFLIIWLLSFTECHCVNISNSGQFVYALFTQLYEKSSYDIRNCFIISVDQIGLEPMTSRL